MDHKSNDASTKTPQRLLDLLEVGTEETWREWGQSWARQKDEVPSDLTDDDFRNRYNHCETIFKQSSFWADLKLNLDIILSHNNGIQNCICFGVGSLSTHRDPETSNCSMFQLVAFLTISDLIEANQSQPVRRIAQEPLFNDVDIRLLQSLSVEVVQHPAAFHELTKDSFAFAPGHEQYVMKAILFYDPAIFFGHHLEPESAFEYWTSESTILSPVQEEVTQGQPVNDDDIKEQVELDPYKDFPKGFVKHPSSPEGSELVINYLKDKVAISTKELDEQKDPLLKGAFYTNWIMYRIKDHGSVTSIVA